MFRRKKKYASKPRGCSLFDQSECAAKYEIALTRLKEMKILVRKKRSDKIIKTVFSKAKKEEKKRREHKEFLQKSNKTEIIISSDVVRG